MYWRECIGSNSRPSSGDLLDASLYKVKPPCCCCCQICKHTNTWESICPVFLPHRCVIISIWKLATWNGIQRFHVQIYQFFAFLNLTLESSCVPILIIYHAHIVWQGLPDSVRSRWCWYMQALSNNARGAQQRAKPPRTHIRKKKTITFL